MVWFRCIAAGLFLLFGAGAAVDADEYNFQYQKIVETDRAIELDLNLTTGRVYIEGGDDHRLIIEAVKVIRAGSRDEAEEVADHIEINVKNDGDRIEVRTNYLKLGSRGRSFWNKLLGTGSDSYGDVDFRITLPATRAIRLRTVAAAIELSSIQAEIEIDNASGSTQGEFLFGPITVRQPSGEIDLKWIEGDIKIKSTSGTVTIQQVRGAIDLATYTGNVNIQTELDSPRNYFVETTTGKISFAVPETSSGIVDIETMSGEVATDLPVAITSLSRKRLVGEFGLGGPRIRLLSSSGDVVVTKF